MARNGDFGRISPQKGVKIEGITKKYTLTINFSTTRQQNCLTFALGN